jgi:hypothetical protein
MFAEKSPVFVPSESERGRIHRHAIELFSQSPVAEDTGRIWWDLDTSTDLLDVLVAKKQK